ncbi:MAG: hypothetical protein LBI05_04290, partial [Planctomycetaceae bacterium]|nr:hypothetical protein [Planctomycetaceae bacterium]
GNPPYNVSTQNKNDWIDGLIDEYKKDLNERNIQPLSDDYIKFIRLGQHYIERNGEGILAYISNNGFIDGLIHRQMRKKMLEVFDTIYILDLHGNAKKRETAPDGGRDENVFNIQQGVSINIFVKTGSKKTNELATVFHCDLYGKRKEKYAFLRGTRLRTVKWKKLKLSAPHYFFVPKDFSQKNKYEKGFKIVELFPVNSIGISFRKDNLLVKNNFTPADVKRMLHVLNTKEDEEIRKTYHLKETNDWKLKDKKELFAQSDYHDICAVQYRPFDCRYTYYPLSKIDKIIVRGDSRKNLMQHFLKGENVGLLTCRRQSSFDFQHVFVSKIITERCAVSLQTSEATYVFPLYLYPSGTVLPDTALRTPNLDAKIVEKIAQAIQLEFEPEKSGNTKKFAPIDILDYIYAVLHSPTYREKYKEFLKIDFPRVPYPDDVKTFWQLVKLGGKLRKLHLMEGVEPLAGTANFPIAGSNEVEKTQYADDKVSINTTQYFDHVTSNVWNFYIGGYQPAQKWLKDRKGKTLNFDDIQHYRKIVCVLTETMEVMDEIDACCG